MLPDIFTSLSGEKITSGELWRKFRRGEILNLFEQYVYGVRPKNSPDNISFSVDTLNENKDGVLIRRINVLADGYPFYALSFTPVGRDHAPVFLYYMHEFQEESSDLENEPNCKFIPISDIVARGYAVVVLYFNQIYPDRLYGYDHKTGIFKNSLPSEKNERDCDWASISAWAYAGSIIADYIEGDRLFDAGNMAVAGHSRGGKTALWTAATDERFAFSISNSSGCMGAALLRGKSGEHLAEITKNTEWFNKNLAKYAQNEEMLPVDQHMLLALIAPRLVYVQSSSEDLWADPSAERRSARLASEVYERMYGISGAVLPSEEEIKLDTPYHDGHIGHHTESGEHKITAADWDMFIAFWVKHRK